MKDLIQGAFKASLLCFYAQPATPRGRWSRNNRHGNHGLDATSTALVLLMIPGLAMFYGGLVRTKMYSEP